MTSNTAKGRTVKGITAKGRTAISPDPWHRPLKVREDAAELRQEKAEKAKAPVVVA
jgi:hypothetical protein